MTCLEGDLPPGSVSPCLHCTLVPAAWVLLGKEQPPLRTEQPVWPVLHSRTANRLPSSLLPQLFGGYSKADGSMLIHNQQQAKNKPVCQLGLCFAPSIPCWKMLVLSLGALAPTGSSLGEICLKGSLLSFPKLRSLRSGFVQVGFSLRAARFLASHWCRVGLHLVQCYFSESSGKTDFFFNQFFFSVFLILKNSVS